MTSTLVGYFEDYTEAQRTERDLIDAGFRGDDVSVVSQHVDGMELREGSAQQEGWWDRFKSAFGFADEHERSYYEQAARRGGALLTVRVPDDQAGTAAAIIERHHPVDLDQQGGSTAYGTSTAGTGTLTGNSAYNATASSAAVGGVERESETIPLAQEELAVGKRVVQRGGVRIHTYVTERPVEESVTLREQQAFVERIPVDRVVAPGEAAFQERTLEVQELGEEVVVSKQARVVEEVRVGKEETAHTETVRDTVRKTELDVDPDSAAVTRKR